METQSLSVAQLRTHLAAKSEEINVLNAQRTRLLADLSEAEATENRVRALVKTGDVAPCELTKPQSEAANLRALVAELETDIAALIREVGSGCDVLMHEETIERLRALARAINTGATTFHESRNAGADGFKELFADMMRALSLWTNPRSEAATFVHSLFNALPRDERDDGVYRSGHEARVAHANRLLAEVAADGTDVRNLWGALPHNRPFAGGDWPVSDVPSEGDFRALMDLIIAGNGSVKV